ncbi:MAG TPA: AI-2E family transporter [Lacunisphaera sp.]|jgi:predicted PurR-regulated permease PerM
MNFSRFNPDTKRISTVGEEKSVVRFELSVRSLLLGLALIAAVWLLINLVPILLVLITALMLVGALSPIVTWLEERNVRRSFALCTIFGVAIALVVALAVVTVPTIIAQLRSLLENEPVIRERVAIYLQQSHYTAPLADDLRNLHYTDLAKSFKTTLVSMGADTLETFAYSVAAVFLAFYIMLDRDRLRGALFAVVPRAHHIRLSRILLNLVTIVGGYIRGQILTCLLMSGFILVLLLACRVPNALAIAAFGGVMDLLPYIGIFLTMGPAVLAATVKGPVVVGIVFGSLLAYEELESRVLVPLVYGRALRLPSSVVFFSLLVGTALDGIVGALLALPSAAAILMLVQELRVELPGEAIQPKDIEQRREDDRSEQEYERRSESMPAEQAAAIAVEISGERKKEEEESDQTESTTPEIRPSVIPATEPELQKH